MDCTYVCVCVSWLCGLVTSLAEKHRAQEVHLVHFQGNYVVVDLEKHILCSPGACITQDTAHTRSLCVVAIPCLYYL